jgi:hypothetical protein
MVATGGVLLMVVRSRELIGGFSRAGMFQHDLCHQLGLRTVVNGAIPIRASGTTEYLLC